MQLKRGAWLPVFFEGLPGQWLFIRAVVLSLGQPFNYRETGRETH